MFNRRYDKAFIMLRQEVSGFSMGERPVWGSCTIEIKNGEGRFNAYAQGLKKLTDGREYMLYVVAGKAGGSIGVPLCPIEVDASGKGEIKKDFNPDNVEGTGLEIEAFNVAAVMIKNHTNQNTGIMAPLVGYRESKINWKNNFNEFKKGSEKIVVFAASKPKEVKSQESKTKKSVIEKDNGIKQPSQNVSVKSEIKNREKEIQQPQIIKEMKKEELPKQELPKQEPKEEFATAEDFYGDFTVTTQEKRDTTQEKRDTLQEKRDTLQEKRSENTFVQIARKFKKELEDLEKIGVLSESEIADIKNPKTSKSANKEIEYIFKNNRRLAPFSKNDGCQWRSISLEEMVLLPFESSRFMKQPFLVFGYRKYKHLVLGRNLEGNYFLGVPDQYAPEYKLLAQRLGFLEFYPCEGGKVSEGEYGYWMKKMPNTKI